jgi:hypothetical protein
MKERILEGITSLFSFGVTQVEGQNPGIKKATPRRHLGATALNAQFMSQM